ncbi:MAG TPA: DMT family transporter [Mycobacteriales bacterium]|nr:DMT family transporter [Mycobacteriales bacterium]
MPSVTPRSALLRLAVLGGIWGTSFLFIKVALEGLAPLQVALGRSVAGAAALWLIVALRRMPVPRAARTWGHIAVLAVVGVIVPFLGFAWAGERVSSGVSGVYNATTPLMTMLIALAVLSEERATRERVAGLLLGFVGVVVVLGPWRGADDDNQVSGQLAALAASASYGVALNYARRFLSTTGISPVVLSSCQLSIGVVVLALAAPLAGWQPVTLTSRVVGAMLALGVLGTGVAFVIYHGLIRDVGATTASMVTFLIPVVAVALGVVVLDEPLGWNLFVGGAVVIFGVALAEGRLRRRRRVPVPSAATTEAVPAAGR